MNWAVFYFVSEWAIRLIMLVYVPQRRTPAAARAWLLLIFIFPWPGLVLYAILGRPRIPPRRMKLQREVSRLIRESRARWSVPASDEGVDLSPQWKQASLLAENLGEFGLCGGNSFELLTDYNATIDRLVAEIESSRRHVHLLYYIFADDAVGRRVATALAGASGRGVKCRVLMDAVASRPALARLAPKMREDGIEVIGLMPVHFSRRRSARADLRNHRKIAVIDGAVAYFGSQNIVSPEFVKDCSNEELVARVTGPLVSQLQAALLMDRFIETASPLEEDDLFPAPTCTGRSLAQTLPSGPTYLHENAHRIMVALMYGARRRIVITTPYFIPDDIFLLAMETAVQRGVEVHLIVSERSNQLPVNLAQKSYYDELLEGGVRIHLYQGHFLHAKHLSIDDDVALIGSSNMDIRSFALNSEVSVLIYDAGVVSQLRTIQERYIAHSRTITRAEWKKRPPGIRVIQNVARLADSLL